MTFAMPTSTLDFFAFMMSLVAATSLCLGWLMARGNRVAIVADANGITGIGL
jgi:hypothetical protein